MRKFIFMALFCLGLVIESFGQSTIEGLGKFKLGKTKTSYLDTFSLENGYGNDVTNSSMVVYTSSGKVILKLIKDTIETYNSPSYSHFCSDVDVYYIPELTISGIEIKELYLTFYKDTLVEMNMNYSSELVEAIELKYGKVNTEVIEKTSNCVTSYGRKFAVKDKMYYNTWKNGRITCICAIGDYRNSECKQQTLAYVNFSLKIGNKIDKCDEESQKRIERRKNSAKKKALSDF